MSEKSTEKEIRQQALSIMAKGLLAFTVGLFLFSPCQQLIMRLFSGKDSEQWVNIYKDIKVYQDMISKDNLLALFTAALCYIYFIYSLIARRKEPHPPLKERAGRAAPLLMFWALALLIPIATIVRGPNEYDLTGHPYMYESIFSYMLYPTCYFFCAAMIWQEKSKRILIYLLLFSSLPINLISLYSEWINKVDIYIGAGVSAVFHNSNHYGYYLAVTIIAGGLTFAYEKNLFLKTCAAVCASVAAMVLIINNTLGAYLAVLFIFILFVFYSIFIVKRDVPEAVAVLSVFLLITFYMSFFYHTIMSSFVTLFHDINMIVADPLEADSAGSARWALWKGTVEHIGDSPVFGFGVEGMLNTYHVGTPHNEFLQYAEFFGIPASLLYIAACSTLLLKLLRNCKVMTNTTMICFFVALGYLASSFFGVAIYYTTPFVYIFLGLAYAEYFKFGNSLKTTE